MSDSKGNLSGIIADFPAGRYADLQYSDYEDIRKAQTSLLIRHIEYTVLNSPFYKKLFRYNGIDYREIRTIHDLRQVPVTEKSDLTDANEQFLAAPQEDVVDVCLTSATTGNRPAALLQTRSDLARLAYNEELAFEMAGIDSKDTLLVAAALDRCFMAGLAYYLGGLKLCARTVRAGAGSPAQLWQLLKCTGTTAVVGVPSLMWKMAQYAIENGEDPSRAGVRRLIAIGEPVRDRSLALLPVTRQLEDVWDARVYSTYASTESATSFCECSARQGGHLRPELVVLEIVDQKCEAVPDGEPGEVVVTPLGITGMPFIRFNTGDVSFVIRKECPCGRKTPRLGPVLGRKNQMLKYKGTTIYPNTIISVIEGKKDFVGGYVEARRNEDGTDRVILYVSVADPLLSMKRIKDEFRARIRVVPEIRIISKKELYEKTDQPQKRKKTTFFDLR